VTVNFSESVTLIGGNLSVNLDTGGTVTITPFGPATSASGTYTVTAGQNSPALNSLSPLVLGTGATLRDAAQNNAVLTIPSGQALANHSTLVINTNIPTIISVTSTTPNGTYGVGATINITVNFSGPVTLAGGTLTVNLSNGGTATISPFPSAASASATYTVLAGQSSPDLDSLSPLVLAAGATLRDAANNDVVLTIPAGQSLANTRTIVIDTTAPAVTSITSTTPDGSYGLGATINVTVNFSKPVTLMGGNLIVDLDSGGTVTINPFGPATSASGIYTVGPGQNSPDLDSLSPLALTTGATLRDAAGNDAALTVPPGHSLASTSTLVIDTTAPTIAGVTSFTPDGIYGIGASINVTVNFSEPVSLTGGDLVVTLDSGGTVVIAPFGQAISAAGTYTVAAGQTSPRLNSLSPLFLTAGAMLRDPTGNDTLLAVPAGQGLAEHNFLVIDGIAPTVTVTPAAGQSDPTRAVPINFTVVFSEPVVGFSSRGVILSGTAGATTAVVTGGGTTYTIAVSGMTHAGTVSVAIAAGAAADAAGNPSAASLNTGATVRFRTQAFLATGADVGGLPEVNVYDVATGAMRFAFLAYSPNFLGGVRVAVGDVNGDGTPDIITAPGPGAPPLIEVFSGRDGHLLSMFFAFPPSFIGGAYVAAGDANGDGFADIIVGADAGGPPVVAVYSGRDGSMLEAFLAFPAFFSGGVRVAAGDIEGTGRDDIVVGAGPGGVPAVEVFRGSDGALLSGHLAYPLFFAGGVYVAAADVAGTGRAQVITGPGLGAPPVVGIFDGRTGQILSSFVAFPPQVAQSLTTADPRAGLLIPWLSGARVGAVDLAGDGHAALVVSGGAGVPARVRMFGGTALQLLDEFFAFDPGFQGGVFVNGG
jgi:hypothetical protein